MNKLYHSVSLDRDKCTGCTTCLKRCPTEAIRIRNGHAVITTDRCIDCGECIRLCPHKAKKALFDSFETLDNYKWKVAVPAPALYGQFDNLDDPDYVLTGLLEIGFDDVFEVACAAELVTEYTRQYMKRADIVKPVISSACPVVAKLISKRFSSLCENVLPVLQPAELAAQLARKRAMESHPELSSEDIGIFFISPCPAKAAYAKKPFGVEKTDIDHVLSMSDVYFRLVSPMNKIETPKSLSKTGLIGISWANSGGESMALFNDKYLAADGIENVIEVLDALENEKMKDMEFIELNACHGGCVGGVATVENPYIAKARLKSLRRYLPVSQNHLFTDGVTEKNVDDTYLWTQELEYSPVSSLSANMAEAMKRMRESQSIYASLPHLDCGSCGSPNCQAFADDVVAGVASIDDCIIRMRETIHEAMEILRQTGNTDKTEETK